jgi:hypothetical protein
MIEFMSRGTNNRRQQMEFKEIKLTVQEQQQLEQDIRDKQHEYLFKVGYKREGIYIITFPNAKKYLGSSLCLGTRLKEIFGQLFWHNKIKQKWIEKALEENKGMKDFRDLSIKIVYTEKGTSGDAFKVYCQMAQSNDLVKYYNKF